MIPVAKPKLDETEIRYVNECLQSGWLSSGKYVERFEDRFASYCGVRFGVATCNGTAALHLALASLGIGPGDEVIVPSLTYVATANAVAYTGASPVFADCDSVTWNIRPDSVERCLSNRTRVIIPVHLYGYPADMEAILTIARRHGLYVVEDAAEAHGATIGPRRVGSFGHIGCFSFYGNKILTTGEGGMCVTDDAGLAARMRHLRNQASTSRRYWHDKIGFNYHMTDVQAALGLAQFEKLDSILERKQEIAAFYASALSDIRGIQPPPDSTYAKNVYWMYSILINEAAFGIDRDQLGSYLAQHQVETRPFFPLVSSMPPYRNCKADSLEVAYRVSMTGLNLPSGNAISDEELKVVADLVHLAYKGGT